MENGRRLNNCEKAERSQILICTKPIRVLGMYRSSDVFCKCGGSDKQEEDAPLLSWRKGKLRKNVESYCLRGCEVI